MQMTDRELLVISDHIRDDMGLVEKYSMYSQMVQDQEIRQLLQSHQSLLQNHLQTLRNFIQPQSQMTMQPGAYQSQPNVSPGFNQPGITGRGSY